MDAPAQNDVFALLFMLQLCCCCFSCCVLLLVFCVVRLVCVCLCNAGWPPAMPCHVMVPCAMPRVMLFHICFVSCRLNDWKTILVVFGHPPRLLDVLEAGFSSKNATGISGTGSCYQPWVISQTNFAIRGSNGVGKWALKGRRSTRGSF